MPNYFEVEEGPRNGTESRFEHEAISMAVACTKQYAVSTDARMLLAFVVCCMYVCDAV